MAARTGGVLIWSCLGGTLLLVAGALWLREYVLRHDAVEVQGTVVALEQRRSKTNYVYAPVVNFETAAGPRRIVGNVASSGTTYQVGERIGVLVDPNNSDNAIINSVLERHFFSLFAGVPGVLALTAALVIHAVARRR